MAEIYAIQMPLPCGCAGPIKIGITHDVAARLRTLQVGSPYELTLLATVDGTVADEAALHLRLARDRMRGEWFRPTPEVIAVVGLLRAGALPPDSNRAAGVADIERKLLESL